MIQKTLGSLWIKNFDAMILKDRPDDNISHMRRDFGKRRKDM